MCGVDCGQTVLKPNTPTPTSCSCQKRDDSTIVHTVISRLSRTGFSPSRGRCMADAHRRRPDMPQTCAVRHVFGMFLLPHIVRVLGLACPVRVLCQ